MSITVNFYFNHPDALAKVAESINGWLGCSLMPYENDQEDFFCRFLGMEFSLFEHNLENDRELNFEAYRYEIGFRTPVPDGDLRPIQLSAIALISYALFSRMGLTGMLVYDVQILLAKYEGRKLSENGNAQLYDLISNEFVSFPNHLEVLSKRLEKLTNS